MSQENVEMLRRAYAAYNAAMSAPNPLKALRAAWEGLADPAIEWVPVPNALDDTFHGVDGVMEFFAETLEAFEQVHMIPERFIDHGDRVLVFLRGKGRARMAGLEIDEPWAHLITVRDGRILRLEQFRNRADALEAAGLWE